MIKLTERAYKQKLRELRDVTRDLEKSKENIAKETARGDLRENSERDAAIAASQMAAAKKAQLEAELAECEIVAEDNSARINIGSYVEVTKVDKNNNPLGKTRTFRVEEHGDTVIKGVLGIYSSLGKTILNGTSNYYDLPDNGGIRYFVQKVAAPE